MPREYDLGLLITQIVLIAILLAITIYLLRLIRAINYEKRISRYTIEAINKKNVSLFDLLSSMYLKLQHKVSRRILKINFLNRYSSKYIIYIDKSKRLQQEPIDYVTNKIFLGILFILIVIIANAVQYKSFAIIPILIAFIFGFYSVDLFLISKRRLRKYKIENDLLKALIIMNNCFKSGRSTMQAIEVVAEELDGPLAEEFKKMYIDLTYGLNLETVFGRFSKRINVSEVKYITTSLIILNKTGGNIVKVFSSIEKSFFSRRKLQDELKALTASANAIFKILVAIPLFIFALIFMLNPSYFKPLISNRIGLIILAIILLIYICYIYIVSKIMKVKEN